MNRQSRSTGGTPQTQTGLCATAASLLRNRWLPSTTILLLTVAIVLAAMVLIGPLRETRAVEAAVFMGDSYAGGSGMGGNGDANLASRLAARYGWRVTNVAVGGTGYVLAGPAAPYPAQLRPLREAGPTDLVIIEGSRNDANQDPLRITTAAVELYRQVHEIQPAAQLVVVGPIAPTATTVPPNILRARDAVHVAADTAGIPFIDPLADSWLDRQEWIGRDGVHPTDDGHRQMAERLEATLQQLGLAP